MLLKSTILIVAQFVPPWKSSCPIGSLIEWSISDIVGPHRAYRSIGKDKLEMAVFHLFIRPEFFAETNFDAAHLHRPVSVI